MRMEGDNPMMTRPLPLNYTSLWKELRDEPCPKGPPIVRPTDPTTSRLAADKLTHGGGRETMKGIVYAGLEANPGLTAKELEAKLGYSDGAVRKRLTDLEADGLAERGPARVCRISGERAQTWNRALHP
jgi:hypothetical protein